MKAMKEHIEEFGEKVKSKELAKDHTKNQRLTW